MVLQVLPEFGNLPAVITTLREIPDQAQEQNDYATSGDRPEGVPGSQHRNRQRQRPDQRRNGHRNPGTDTR